MLLFFKLKLEKKTYRGREGDKNQCNVKTHYAKMLNACK